MITITPEEQDERDEGERESLAYSLQRARYAVVHGGRYPEDEDCEEEGEDDVSASNLIPSGVWSIAWGNIEDFCDAVTPTAQEAPLFRLLTQTCEQLIDFTQSAAPVREALPLSELPADVYRQWNVAMLLLLSLWEAQNNFDNAVWDLALALRAEPDALQQIGFSFEDLPLPLRNHLIKAPTFLFPPDPPVVNGIQRIYQSKINAQQIATALKQKPVPVSVEAIRAAPWLYVQETGGMRRKVYLSDDEALNAPLTGGERIEPYLPPLERLVQDEPPLTTQTLQERIGAVRRHWREQGVQDDYLEP